MIPDNVAEELAVIYGEQPAQTPATPEPEPEPASEGDQGGEKFNPDAAPEMPLLGGLHYRVEPGDTPASIATAMYGDACHAAALVEHNQRAGLLINDNLTINGVILLP